jgi:murein DD-endopeptidase MepM/ murein hydrolase activator NlpD
MFGKSRAAQWLARNLPSRQIILASQGIYRHVAISSLIQAVAVFFLFLTLTWGIFVSYRYIAHEDILASREQELSDLRIAHRVLAAQASEQKMQIAQLEQNLNDKIAQVASLTNRSAVMGQEMASLRLRLGTVEDEKVKLSKARDSINNQLAGLQDRLSAGKVKKTSDSSPYPQHSGIIAVAVGEIPRRSDEALHVGVSPPPSVAPVAEGLLNIESGMRSVIDQRDLAVNEQEALKERLKQLDTAFADLQASQVQLLQRVSTLTVSNTGDVEKAFALVGLDPNSLLERNRRSGVGGPFIPVGTDFGSPELRATLASLNMKLDRLDNMSSMVRSLPLAAPLDNYTINSAFGTRNDPINELTGVHEGVDIGSPFRQPSVHSTASGRVVFAGWRGRYGRLVEVDHGNGIHTRYAHLSKIAVRVGQKVDVGTSVGNMGNSGRSTGQHLHYEVLVDGKPRDPMKFLKAGKYVLKKQQAG